MKKIISCLITIMMVFTMMPYAAFAESGEDPSIEAQKASYTWINPIYEDVVEAGELESADEYAVSAMSGDEEIFTNHEAAGKAIRGYLENHVTSFSIKYDQDKSTAGEDWINTLSRGIINEAAVHTGVSTQGDAIMGAIGGYKASFSYYEYDTYYAATITYTVTYHHDADQEIDLQYAIENLKSQLNIADKTDYEKVKAIYDYMTANITYDYDNLKDDSYKLKYSAYAALINKTAVCQGYAVLFYRLALEYDIDARVISGTGNGGPHAWNIVEIDGKYYNLDATWDAPRAAKGLSYDYFLKSTGTFGDHTSDAEFMTEEFKAAYPISECDYTFDEPEQPSEPEQKDCTHANQVVLPAVDATCYKDGLTEGKKCADCGEITVTQTVVPKGHKPGAAATCTLPQICTVCKVKMVAATGKHSYGAYKTTTKATFGKAGIKTATCTVCKKAKKTKTIAAVKTPTLSAIAYTFNNKVKAPAVKVAGISSKLYTVTYAKGRKNVGQYSVKVTFKSNADYTGSKTVYFKINPAKPTGVKLTKGKKQFKVSWKKPAVTYRNQIDGYEVRYATSKSGLNKVKPKKYSGKTLTNKTIKKLKAKKKYYVQVRTYNKIGKTVYYSEWTTAKSVKTK